MENELVRIEVSFLPHLYRFLRGVLTLDPSSVPEPQKNFFRLTIYPSTLVLSIYKYSILSTGREKELRVFLGANYNHFDIISCGAMSMFKPVEIKENENVRIDLDYHRSPNNIFKIENIYLRLAPITGNPYLEYNTQMEVYFDAELLDEAFKMLNKIEGKRTQTYLGKLKSKIEDTLYFFESSLTIIGNVLYPLYKDKYRSNIQVPELTKFADLIKTYGNTFNEVIENIVALSMISHWSY
jgi:hypothetical protein